MSDVGAWLLTQLGVDGHGLSWPSGRTPRSEGRFPVNLKSGIASLVFPCGIVSKVMLRLRASESSGSRDRIKNVEEISN